MRGRLMVYRQFLFDSHNFFVFSYNTAQTFCLSAVPLPRSLKNISKVAVL